MFDVAGSIAARELDACLSRLLRQELGRENWHALRLVIGVIRLSKNVLSTLPVLNLMRERGRD
jgi:hypothetical protein